jgi:hypothetical protein
MSERLILNNDSTKDTLPSVTVPRELAEWFAALLEAFPHLVRRFGVSHEG